jgi:hypothetical protein
MTGLTLFFEHRIPEDAFIQQKVDLLKTKRLGVCGVAIKPGEVHRLQRF